MLKYKVFCYEWEVCEFVNSRVISQTDVKSITYKEGIGYVLFYI